MNAQTKQAIKDLSAQGWTRQKISDVLGVSLVEIRDVLGKTARGRKPVGETKKKEVKKAVQKVDAIIDMVALDQSSSMMYVRKETAEGVNQYITDAKTKAKEAKKAGIKSHMGIITFQSRARINTKVKLVSSMKANFKGLSGGLTALNDGLILAIEEAKKTAKKYKNPNVTITVFTDGGENSSDKTVNYTANVVKECRDNGWTIAFVGPRGCEDYANMLNIAKGNVLTYDTSKKEDFTKSYNKMRSARSAKTDDITLGKFSSTVDYFSE